MWWFARGRAACREETGARRCTSSRCAIPRLHAIPFRLDAGVISSPLGLTTLELRPDRNPTIGAPFYYFVPLPPFDGNFDRVTLMSGGYPLGAILSASGTHWDIRGGLTDATPARARSVFSSSKAPAAPQLVLGGGVTPSAGLRFGAGLALGRYRVDAAAQKNMVIPDSSYGSGTSTNGVIPRGAPLPDETAAVFNVEGEYAIGYTRVSGEIVVDRFETLISPAVTRGFNVVAVRTLSPRWFTAGRIVGASTPVLTTPTPVRTGRKKRGSHTWISADADDHASRRLSGIDVLQPACVAARHRRVHGVGAALVVSSPISNPNRS